MSHRLKQSVTIPEGGRLDAKANPLAGAPVVGRRDGRRHSHYRAAGRQVVIPLFCDLVGKRVVIVGGGGVALRKARRFAREATVSVHSPAFHAEFSDLDCELVRERVDAERGRELFADAFLVAVATDNGELNGRLTALAREQGCLVNRADRSGDDDGDGQRDESEAGGEGDEDDGAIGGKENGEDVTTTEVTVENVGDVIVPSSIDADPITVAVSTGGRSPAMAKYLRERLEPVIEEAAPMVRLQGDLRAELKRVVEGSDERRERLWAVIESEAVWDALDAGDPTQARRLAREKAGLSEE